MGQKKAIARKAMRSNARFVRLARSLAGNFAYVFLGGAVIFFAAVVILAAQRGTPDMTQMNAAATHAAATIETGSGWIPLASDTPGAIIAAARKATLFNVDRSGDGDYLKDVSRLETPVLVRALRSPGSIVMPDYYVIPIDDKSGAMVGAAELALNPTHTAVQLTSVLTYSAPRTHGHLARVAMSAAQADLTSQRHVAMRVGTQAQLVYVPIDATALESGEVTWNGGGIYPADPIWLIPGTDGQDHVVGADGNAYAMSSVPIMKQP